MTRNIDLIRVVAISLAAMVIAAGLNALVDTGALLHDVFCAGHGGFAG